jgi:histidinol-phosphate aminotransferase
VTGRPTIPVRVREAVLAAPPYVPGRRPDGASRVARLASNELAFEPLPEVLDALQRKDIHRYPEPSGLPLRAALARGFGISEESLVVSPGSVALARLLVETVCDPADEVVFAWRSFEAYPLLVQLAGAAARAIPLTASGEHDLPAMAAAVSERTKLIFVCTPNNPTGCAISREAFEAFLDAVPSDVLVVLDEAYVEFGQGWNGLPLLASRPNLLVLRTFSKAYGLAGARVGWAACDPALAGLLRSAQVPFAVAQPSIDLAIAALSVPLDERVAGTVERRDAFATWLDRRGIAHTEARGNFVWLPLGHLSVKVATALAERRVLVRPFDGEGIRITVGDDDDMAMLRGALAEVL